METIVPTAEEERAAQMLHALGSPVRVAIVHYIVEHPGCICNDLVLRFGRAQATISQHLAVLRHAGLIEREHDGHTASYAVDRAAFGWLVEELQRFRPGLE